MRAGIPSFRGAVRAEVVNNSEAQVIDRPISIEAIALTRTIITNAVPIALVQRITP